MSESDGSDTAPSATLPNEPIPVALIEDNRLVRDAVASLLNRAGDFRVVAGDAGELEAIVQDIDARVVLLDLGLESGDSLRVAREVRKSFPDARVIVMDLLPAEEELTDFVNAGVSGFIMKDAAVDVVMSTIRSVAAGMKVLPDQITGTLFSEIARETVSKGGTRGLDSVRMTPREKQVIDLIAEGLSNKAIAKRLDISTHTVKSHLRNIMDKLTLHSRLQIAAYAHKRDELA